MMTDGQTILGVVSRLALTLLVVSAILTFIRLLRGPRAADRVVAMDLIAVLVVAFLAAYAIYAGDRTFLDVAIAYALVAFLGTVALSRFLLRSGKPDRRPDSPRRMP